MSSDPSTVAALQYFGAAAAADADDDYEAEEEEEEDEAAIDAGEGAEASQRRAALACAVLTRQQPPRAPRVQHIRSSSITYEQLSTVFHLCVRDAAVALGVCRTTLKSVCRNLGISRWPKRELMKAGKLPKPGQPIPRPAAPFKPAPPPAPPAEHAADRSGSLIAMIEDGAEALCRARACSWMT